MQGILDLDNHYRDNVDNFLASYANFEAHNAILNWRQWQNKRLLIVGPPKSGKTLLAQIWQKNTEAVFVYDTENTENIEYNERIIIDNIENFPETSLINIINFASEKSLSLLLTGTKYPSFSLSDLNSRIKATYRVVIKEPDEGLSKLLLAKLFKQKQVKISEKILDFILSHMERSYESIYEIVNFVDKLSKMRKKKITVSFVKEIFVKNYNIDVV